MANTWTIAEHANWRPRFGFRDATKWMSDDVW
jgi:hypothetical protein